MTFLPASSSKASKNSTSRTASKLPSTTIQRALPWLVTVEIIDSFSRLAGAQANGVSPLGARQSRRTSVLASAVSSPQ